MQYTTPPIFNVEIYVGWGCILNCCYHPYLVSILSADLLSLHLVHFYAFLVLLCYCYLHS